MKKERGITLIALVITIIIMLILVGVVIHELGSDNGIIVKARWAEFVTEYERVDEAKELYAAGKIIDRYDDEAKFTLESLFSNVSYAEEKNDTLYPVDLNQRFYISEALETLKDTIRIVEKLDDYELYESEKVDLYRVDLGLLNDIEVKREYIINIVSGIVYYIDGEPYRDRIYHTLRYGSPKDLNNPDASDPDDSEDEDSDKPTVDPELKIHYLSGFDRKEYTQKVKQSQSYSVALNPVEFRRNEYIFLYWKDVTDEKWVDEDDEKPEINFVYKTGGYYDIANQLINILDEMWETDILEIIEDNADYEPDPDDDECAPNAETQMKNQILDYLSVYQAEIQAILQADMSVDGLAGWFINNTSYLTQLEEYELEYWTGEEEEPDDEEQEIDYDTYGDQDVVNMGGQDIWLEAVWTQNFIVLDANGGKVKGKDTINLGVEEGKTYGTGLNVVPVRANYVFAGWFTEKDGGIQKVKSDIYSAADLPAGTLYAHWEDINSPNIVNITFNANGGTMKDANKKTVKTLIENRVRGNKIATFPTVQPETEKKDWYFKGWFTSAEGGTKVDENTIINENMTVYAQWTNEPNVTIVLNGGELFTRYTDPIKIEERYNQWNPKKYYDGIDNSKIYAEDGKKVPRQAKGRQLPCTTTFGRKIRKIRTITQTNGKEFKARSTFKGWYTGPNGTGVLVESNGRRNKYYASYGDTLYAYWREKYIVKYDANGGHFGKNENNTWKQKGVFQDKRYPGSTTPKKAGYRFTGWYDSQEGGNKIELGNAGYIVKNSITLYAHWEKVEFTLEISNVTENGWTQTVVPLSDLSGYTVRYQYSISPRGTSGALVSTTKSQHITNKVSGATYYVWVRATRDGDKIYSDVKEVTLSESNLEFKLNVSVTSTNYTGWQQSISVTSGNIEGYNIEYHISTSSQNDSGATTKTGSTTETTTVSSQEEGTTYYVWATATKSGKTFKSTNYVIVNTGHAHDGSSTKKGKCYSLQKTCSGNGTLIKYSTSSSYSYTSITKNRYCQICGTSIAKNTNFYLGGSTYWYYQCTQCGAYESKTITSASTPKGAHVCSSCYNGMTNKYSALTGGYLASTNNSPASIGMWGSTSKVMYASTINHTYYYSLSCTKTSRSTTATEKNF